MPCIENLKSQVSVQFELDLKVSRIKFGFSEKATEFEKIFVELLTRASCSVRAAVYLSKRRRRFFQNKCGQVGLYKL